MCVIPPEGEAEAGVKAELGAEPGLVEEDLVAVSYMGDELDLETVGGIIAIIEEKVGPPGGASLLPALIQWRADWSP